MVHVGQTDMPVDRVRSLAPGLGVGISTHTIGQLAIALALRPTYVAFGPVFETTTKGDPDPATGLAALREAHRLASAAGIPLVAIGGISRDRAPVVAPISEAIAVISGLVPPDAAPGDPPRSMHDVLRDVVERARSYSQLFAPIRCCDATA
jgi:thiamine-phosphate pyrophosphorylase